MPAPRLVGRHDALVVLDELIRSLVEDGVGGCAVLTGPAGIGKTALAREAVARATAAGAGVLRARGSELEGSLSFGGVRDLLGPSRRGAVVCLRPPLAGL